MAIGRLTVHRAGYGVLYGSQLAGVIELEHDLGLAAPFDLTVRGDPLAVNVRGRLRTAKTTGLLALRHSLWGLYQEPGLQALLRQWNTVDPLMVT